MDGIDAGLFSSLITSVLQGGHVSVVAILLIDVIIIVIVARAIIRYLTKVTTAQVDELKAIIASKDKIIYEQSNKFEIIIDKYYTNQNSTLSCIQRMETVIGEIQNRLVLVIENRIQK